MQNSDDLIHSAKNAIGKGNSDEDWKITPTEHAKMFKDKAPSLAENLCGARTTGIAIMYEESNNKAIKARDDFKNTVNKANMAILITASFAALLLIVGGLQILLGTFGDFAIKIVGIFGFISSALASMWLTQVKGGTLAENGQMNAQKQRPNGLHISKPLCKVLPKIPWISFLPSNIHVDSYSTTRSITSMNGENNMKKRQKLLLKTPQEQFSLRQHLQP